MREKQQQWQAPELPGWCWCRLAGQVLRMTQSDRSPPCSCRTNNLCLPCCPACRGHAGGLLGGALVTWLLGPRLVRDASGIIVDRPPVPLLAHKPLHGPSLK